MTSTFFLIGKILMILFYIMRLYKIFNNTSMKYQKKPLKCLASFVIIGFTLVGLCFTTITIGGFASAPDIHVNSFEECYLTLGHFLLRDELVIVGICINLIVDLIVSIIILRYV